MSTSLAIHRVFQAASCAASTARQPSAWLRASAATTKFIITRKPEFDALKLEPKEWQPRVQEVGTIMDVTDVDLKPFRAKGGKLILVHGTVDDFITPHNSVAYYKRHRVQQGQANMDSFVRFYLVPGLSHGFGPFNAKYDGLAVLDNWVETDNAPGTLIATDGNPGAARSRPMCIYPRLATLQRLRLGE